MIWIHAVSVGEVKAAQPLFRALKRAYPTASFLVTTVTETGQAEAKRSLPDADFIARAPYDFPWTVRRWVKRYQPKLFILVETDFWPNLLREVRKAGGVSMLVSGKLSPRSAKRFRRFSFLSKKLFGLLDLLCIQNEEHAERFLPLLPDPSRLHITGNLKLDLQPQPVDVTSWHLTRPAIAITCTHPGEEELLLEPLLTLPYTFFLAPRHPDRFEEVAQLLQRKQIPFSRWKDRREAKVILIDAMGQLPMCYSLSRLAIVGGSFTGAVGGHNILEPCLYGIPVFFGPSMYAQTELASRVLRAGAGKQLSAASLRGAIERFFEEEAVLRTGARQVIEEGRGATQRTLEQIQAKLAESGVFK